MSGCITIFEVGDIVDWETRVPWHKIDGPFVVVRIFDELPNACACGQLDLHFGGDPCQPMPQQLLVVRALASEWVIIDQHTGAPAVIASRFFKKV